MAWLLTVDRDQRWLVSQSFAIDRGADAARHFLATWRGDEDDVRFALVHGNNPLAEVVLNKRVLINVPTAQFNDLTGGAVFSRAFARFKFPYISLLPLVTARRAVGALVLGTMDASIAQSRRAQQILNSLCTQAAMVVDNARLVTDLAAREQRMRAEQAFRQMVLDTMGEGLVVVDDEARITYVNNRLLHITGYTRAMLYGQSVGMIFHPDCREQIISSLTNHQRDTLPFAQQLLTHDDQTVPVLLSRAVTTAPNEHGRSTVMVVTDLSDVQHNENALRRQTRRLKAINQASTAISSVRSFQDVIEISLEAALQVVQGISASILLRDAEDLDRLTRIALAGPHAEDAEGTSLAFSDGLAGWVAAQGQSQLANDLSRGDPVWERYAPIYGEDLHAVIAVPLVAFDEVIGVLEVANKVTGDFDDEDLETLESLAGAVAITLENARLFDQMRRRMTELSTLLDSSAAVSSTLELDAILELVARQLILALNVERVVIADWNRQSNRLETLAEVVNTFWLPGDGPLRPIEHLPLTCSVFESGTLMLTQDVAVDGMSAALEEHTPSGLRTIAGFPITMNGQVAGVVALHSETPDAYLSTLKADMVQDVIADWQADFGAEGDHAWLERAALTDLCQRVLQTAGVRWCTVSHWDHQRNEIRVVREIGWALWLEQAGPHWEVEHYPTLARVLEIGAPVTMQHNALADDPREQHYLGAVGGRTCLAIPLLIRGEPSGVVKLVDTKPERRAFDGAEVSLCQGIGHVVGNAMENAQLYAMQGQRASALEAAYTELQEADRIKEEMLQNLSHELRTPLTHILGYLRLLKDQAFGPLNAEQEEALDLMLRKAQELTELVENIMTAQDTRSVELDLRPIHLSRVVELAIRTRAAQAEAQQIALSPRIPPNLPQAFADPIRLGEVLDELLENAIKFSPPESEIEISIADPGGLMLQLSVCDHGIGIPPGEHERIFRRFYQVDSGTTRRYGGAGLGLFIVRQITEAHNGRVWVESEPGQGSCFHLTLPKAIAIGQGD